MESIKNVKIYTNFRVFKNNVQHQNDSIHKISNKQYKSYEL